MTWLVSIVFVAGLFLSRPFRLGVDWTPLGCALMLCAGLAALGLGGRQTALINGLILAGAIAVMWAFLALHALMLGGPGERAALTAFLTNASAAFAAALFFSCSGCADRAFKLVLGFVAVSGLSFAVTIALHGAGVDFSALRWARVPVSDPFYARFGDVLFPLTQVYNYADYAGLVLPRAALGLREAGIAQAFVGWVMIAALYRFPRRGLSTQALLYACGVALVSTQSTALLPTLLLVAGFWVARSRLRLRGKVLAGLLGVIAAGGLSILWLHDDVFGFAAKLDTASMTDRTTAMMSGLAMLAENPLGMGLYNSETRNSGITLVAQLHQIGLVGAALLVVVLVIAHFLRRRVGGTIAPFSVVVLTMITSQPLLDAPGFTILLFFVLQPLAHAGRTDVSSRRAPRFQHAVSARAIS